MRNLVWFKSDLRVRDNPALSVSMTNGSSCAVYVLCVKQWQKHGISLAKRSLLLRQLIKLKAELDALNVPLLVLKGNTFKELPQQIIDLSRALQFEHIYWNKEYELNEKRCEDALSIACRKEGIGVSAFDDSMLYPPGSVLNHAGEFYKVYTSFKRAILKDNLSGMRRLYPMPRPQQHCSQLSHLLLSGSQVQDLLSIDSISKYEANLSVNAHYCVDIAKCWPSGEDHAHLKLEEFISERAYQYDEKRDFPSESVTSGLSPFLAAGILSTRQCLQAALNANEGLIDEGQPGLVAWINELIWREFYRHILASNEALCRFEAFKPETDQLPWQHDRKRFELWQSGQTGFPLVDAAMRQLNQTGWMHNRLRMVVAMFLTKHLFIDWRWGESYFMSKLIDGDFASNNGGWQWAASTGVDAVPYFRIFNPLRQSMRFDPEGEFIRRFVPELGHLSSKDIHQPSVQQAQFAAYPLPMVNHKLATDQTKFYFSQLNKNQALS